MIATVRGSVLARRAPIGTSVAEPRRAAAGGVARSASSARGRALERRMLERRMLGDSFKSPLLRSLRGRARGASAANGGSSRKYDESASSCAGVPRI